MNSIFKKIFFNAFFFILIILLPLQTRYFLIYENIKNNFFEYGSIALYAIDIVFLIFIIYGIFYSIKNKSNIDKKSIIFLSLLILFNASVFSSIFFSMDKIVAVYYFIKILLLSAFSFIIYINKISLDLFMNSFIVSATIQGFLSIYQFIIQSIDPNKYLGIAEHLPYVLGTYVIEGPFGRVLKSYGVFPHPNILGLFLLIGLIFILFKIINHKRGDDISSNKKVDFQMIYLVYVFGINFIGLLFTFSRISIGLFVLFFTSFLIYEISIYFKSRPFNKKINYNLKIFSLLIPIILITALSSSDMLASKVDAKNRLVEKSTNERLSQISDFGTYIQDKYLQGIGIGNYSIYKYNQNKDLNVWDLQPIHNIYLLIVLELGIFGGISFLALILFKFITNRQMEILVPFLSILIFGLFDHFIITLTFGIAIIFIFLGVNIDKDDAIEI